jgi:DNA-binding MarR family transcriptional regulator
MDPATFRDQVRELVRALGVLDDSRTPCGVDLSLREAYALTALGEATARGQSWSQSDLQRALGIDKSNVTRLVQRLRTQGYLEQEVSPEDGRVRTLRLSEPGRQTAGRLESLSRARFASVLEHIDPAERANLERALEVLARALSHVPPEERS